MAGHTSEKRWRRNQNPLSGNTGVSVEVSQVAASAIEVLTRGEESYQNLIELYTYVGSTAQLLADQLFYEDWSVRETTTSPYELETQANVEEVAKTQDAIDAMTSIHELYEAATDKTIAQKDRFADLRRMSG